MFNLLLASVSSHNPLNLHLDIAVRSPLAKIGAVIVRNRDWSLMPTRSSRRDVPSLQSRDWTSL
jgi:hypothetical protein